MAVPHCFPACGTVRTQDERILRLYEKANLFADAPSLWEGLFRLACLLKSKPAEEPVYSRIISAIAETEDGSFAGSFGEQICTARAALVVFEYNTDMTILKRIALWVRYAEIEFDSLCLQDRILFRPADLMELLIRFYQASGVKSALRFCARLRADAFDWTTALHTFQQTIPISSDDGGDFPAGLTKPESMDFTEREKLTNHAEMLADGMRYTVFAGMFSGHSRDLSAGKIVWSHLVRHHHAVCGGTTGHPFLSGNGTDRPVSTAALGAWTEAFASQMILPDSVWALEELIRIAFNGLEDCLSRETLPDTQRVNTVSEASEAADPLPLYARITRAAAAVYTHAVTLTEDSVRVNYLLAGKTLAMIRRQPVILETDQACVIFRSKNPFTAPVELYLSSCDSVSVRMLKNRKAIAAQDNGEAPVNAGYIRTEADWQDGDGLLTVPDDKITVEEAHHRGVAVLRGKRIMCAAADENNFARAACGSPVREGESVLIPLAGTDKWRMKGKDLSDIPVLPPVSGDAVPTALIPYAGAGKRVSVFPKAKNACLK